MKIKLFKTFEKTWTAGLAGLGWVEDKCPKDKVHDIRECM